MLQVARELPVPSHRHGSTRTSTRNSVDCQAHVVAAPRNGRSARSRGRCTSLLVAPPVRQGDELGIKYQRADSQQKFVGPGLSRVGTGSGFWGLQAGSLQRIADREHWLGRLESRKNVGTQLAVDSLFSIPVCFEEENSEW